MLWLYCILQLALFMTNSTLNQTRADDGSLNVKYRYVCMCMDDLRCRLTNSMEHSTLLSQMKIRWPFFHWPVGGWRQHWNNTLCHDFFILHKPLLFFFYSMCSTVTTSLSTVKSLIGSKTACFLKNIRKAKCNRKNKEREQHRRQNKSEACPWKCGMVTVL